MSGKFNAAKTDYNKDETFAQFTVDETVKVTLTEGVAKDSGENYITVYGKVEYPLVGVEKMGDPKWLFEACLCKFQVPKKNYSTEYQGKKKDYTQTPGMKTAIHLIETIGYDKPFAGFFDFSIALPIAESIISGKGEGGKDLNQPELEMMAKYFMRIEPLAELKELKPDTIKEYSKGGSYRGGGGGQKESEVLSDRLAFIKVQMLPDSDIGMILSSLHGAEGLDRQSAIIDNLLLTLFN